MQEMFWRLSNILWVTYDSDIIVVHKTHNGFINAFLFSPSASCGPFYLGLHVLNDALTYDECSQ